MTTSARSASRSVTLPLPSSPHWAPTTTRPGMPCVRRWCAESSCLNALRGGRAAAEVAFLVHVGELRVAAQEREDDLPDWAVAVLGDDDVRLARTLGLTLGVVLVAIDEHDDVGVLLDLARLAQVRQQRLLVRSRLDRARELRHRDHRHLQLAREHLEAAADLADLLDATVRRVLRSHQLQVVDDDQAETVLRVE